MSWFEAGTGEGDAGGAQHYDDEGGIVYAPRRNSPDALAPVNVSPPLLSPAGITAAMIPPAAEPEAFHAGQLARSGGVWPVSADEQSTRCACALQAAAAAGDPNANSLLAQAPQRVAAVVEATGGRAALANLAAGMIGPDAHTMATSDLVAHVGLEGAASASGLPPAALLMHAGVPTATAKASGIWRPFGPSKGYDPYLHALDPMGRRADPYAHALDPLGRSARRRHIPPGVIGHDLNGIGAVADDGGVLGPAPPGVTASDDPIFTGQSAGSTPGAVPVAKENWNFSATPAQYTLAFGDTLMGLAITYLGSGTQDNILKIWHAQPASFRASHSMDHLNAGQILNMPDEATANAKKLTQAGQGATVQPNGEVTNAAGHEVSPVAGVSKRNLMIAAAVGGTALVGGGIYYATR